MKRCEICYSGFNVQKHHVYSRGANNNEAKVKENEIYLCSDHHIEVHNKTRQEFAEKYGLARRFKLAERAVLKLQREYHLGLVR